MTKRRREFAFEFKQETVGLLESSGRALSRVATETGISPSMLRAWRKVAHGGVARPGAGQPNGLAPALPADQAAEISRLKREPDRTRMERDVLKK